MPSILRIVITSLTLLHTANAAHAASYDPAWAAITPLRVIHHAASDGAALVKAVAALKPGDRLELASGTYSVDRMWDIGVSGRAEAPIWIVAAKDAQVIITVYGTAGKPVNIIERNLCYRSADHTMQVQGEAIVRNNVLISAAGSGFTSTDHQGKTINLQVIHNTIVNANHAFSGGSWNARAGMILANNILYSRDENALHFANGKDGVTISGNVVLGNGPKDGCTKGRGLEDFTKLT